MNGLIRKIARASGYTFIFFLLWSCTNPFSARTPEKPDEGLNPTGILTLQLEPDSLMKKMQLAFSSQQLEYYRELFSNSTGGPQSFVFIPQSYYSNDLTSWTVVDEEAWFNHLINDSQLRDARLQLTKNNDWNPITTTTDSMQAYYDYSLRIRYIGRTEYFRGRMLLKILKENYYTIYYWADLSGAPYEADSTWSALKQKYRSQ